MSHRVLIVEANPDLRSILCELLEAEGYSVTSCATGEHALTALREQLPQAVVLDLWDAEETLAGIRANPHVAMIPVVAYRSSSNLERLTVGLAAVLPLPFEFDELCRALMAVIGSR